MIPYFVSYAYRGGFGCIEIGLRYPVRSFKDIQVLAELAGKKVGEPVVILNFRRFEQNVAPPGTDAPVPAA